MVDKIAESMELDQTLAKNIKEEKGREMLYT